MTAIGQQPVANLEEQDEMAFRQRPVGKFCKHKVDMTVEWSFRGMDISQADMDKVPGQIVQRVLEYGEWKDWKRRLSMLSYQTIESYTLELLKFFHLQLA